MVVEKIGALVVPISVKGLYMFNKPAFKHLTRKELYKAFPDLTTEYVDAFYDLYYWALVGLLATAHNDELHTAIQASFEEFIAKCDQLTMDAVAKAQELKENPGLNYPIAEMASWFNEHPSE